MSRTVDVRAAGIPATPAVPVRRWSLVRLAGGVVLAAWAAMFWWLQITGRVNLYLSTKTSWVVPVGAALFTVAALGRLAAARVRTPERLTRREALVMAILVLPVVIVTVLPPATLGTFSSTKKTAFSALSYSGVYGQITATSEITWFSIAAAQTSDAGAQALAKRQGSNAEFVGFVTRDPNTLPDEFLLTRYIITCCVADATIVQVRVVNVTPGEFHDNEWVDVKGLVYPLGREVIVNATSVTAAPTPSKPYLTP